MCARALFRGPAHVVVAVDDEMARLSGCEVIGRPAREVYVSEVAREHQLLMDEVYRTGEPVAVNVISVDGIAGRLVIARSAEGVAVDWRPLPVRVRSARLPVSTGS